MIVTQIKNIEIYISDVETVPDDAKFYGCHLQT